jgi:hypothetical protein
VVSFYEQHITDAIGCDDLRRPLTYDAFVAMTLTEVFEWLRNCGYLAHRGNGDCYDYWLARPAG